MSIESVLGGFAGAFFIIIAIVAVVVIIMIISLWKIFTKAGQPGWASIIPVYNNYILTQIARVNIAYFIVLLTPTLIAVTEVHLPKPVNQVMNVVVVIALILVVYNMCKQFGKGVGYTIGMVILPFIFFPMLAFGDSVYQDEVVSLHEDTPSDPSQNSVPGESSVVAIEDQTPVAGTQ